MANQVPSISLLSGQVLHSLVLASGARRMLELGTARGYSSIWIAAALEENGGNLITIDYSEPTLREAEAHFREAKLDHIMQTRLGNARIHLREFPPESFDAIFLDSEKKATAEFFEVCWGLLKSGGWIVVDDVKKFAYKMVGFPEMLAKLEVKYQILATDPDDGILFAKKP